MYGPEVATLSCDGAVFQKRCLRRGGTSSCSLLRLLPAGAVLRRRRWMRGHSLWWRLTWMSETSRARPAAMTVPSRRMSPLPSSALTARDAAVGESPAWHARTLTDESPRGARASAPKTLTSVALKPLMRGVTPSSSCNWPSIASVKQKRPFAPRASPSRPSLFSARTTRGVFVPSSRAASAAEQASIMLF